VGLVFSSSKDLQSTFNIAYLPYHILIDSAGRTAFSFYGPLDKYQMQFKEALTTLLSERGN
jgi:hypothetical protein